MNRFYLRFALLVLCAFAVRFSHAQTDCGFDQRHKSLLDTDSSYKNSIKALGARLQQLSEIRSLAPNSPLGIVYRIPVVVHVVHRGEAVGVGTNISDAQVQSAITSLTQFYRGTLGSSPDSEIEFALATIDPSCAPTSGIVRVNGNSVTNYSTDGLVLGGAGNELAVKNLSKWSNEYYYNIWIVAEINNNNGGSGIQGFAYFPGTPASVDGAVMLYNAFGYDPLNNLGYNLKTATDENKTAIHELGHAFGLYHTFQGDDSNNDNVADQCPANTSCTSEGDEVCDTEPHRRSPSNCPTGANVCGGILDNIVKNFMDYSSSACQDRFTTGQITRMRDAIALFRPTLPASRGLQVAYPAYPYAAPPAACASTTGAAGMSSDYAGIINVAVNGRNFSSLTPRLDNATNGYLNWTTDCHKLVELIRGGTYTFSASVYALNQEQLRAWIDYNNDGTFDNTTEQIYINPAIPSHPTDYVTVNGTFTVPMSAQANTVLRLRVIEELAPVHGPAAIPDACYDPAYGQTEDIQVYLNALLPIVLESFTGKIVGETGVLSWKTSAQENTKEFQIEKSTDGVHFNHIGTVAANKLTSSDYSFIDRKLVQGVNYYRLRMIDNDGAFEVSRIVILRSTTEHNLLFQVLNNPIKNQSVELQFNANLEGKLQVRVVDLTGKTVANWSGNNVSQTRVKIDLSNKHFSKGVYIIHAYYKGTQFSQKLVVE